MAEVGELRHLLTTTTSALSAAQRNVGQERDARQVGTGSRPFDHCET